MKCKKQLLILITITALTLGILTTSYGYWTDQLDVSGEVSFEFRLPVINDVEMPKEMISEDLQPDAEPDPEPVPVPLESEDEPNSTLEITNEDLLELTEEEGSEADESAESE